MVEVCEELGNQIVCRVGEGSGSLILHSWASNTAFFVI